jgi:putative transcriptional regulator
MAKSILETLHETATDLHGAGVMGKKTLREFDALCLPPIQHFSATEIKSLRERNKASQPVFAAYLNTSESTIQKWERGEKRPSGASLKLLNLVAKKGLEVLA